MEKTRGIVTATFTVVILIGTGIFLFTMIQGTRQEAEVLIGEDKVQITGQYGVTVSLSEIADVQLRDTIPAIGTKTNGAGLGNIKKGDYMVSGLGKCRLFLHTDHGPYLYILTKDGRYTILCYPDREKTKGLYEKLTKAATNA